MPEDTPQGEEQHEMLSFTEAAERLVEDGIAPNMTAEGLRRLARDPSSGWPISPTDYRVVGKTRLLPYDQLTPYMRERFGKRRGRGPDTKKRSPKSRTQGDPVTATTAHDRLVHALKSPGLVGLREEEAAELLDAYRASVLREAADVVEQLIDDGEHDPDCLVAELRSLASRKAASDG